MQDSQMVEHHSQSKEELIKKHKEHLRKQMHLYKQQMYYYNGIPFADCCDN